MKQLLTILLLAATFASIVSAQDADPAEVFEEMKKSLKGEWRLSEEAKQIDTTGAYKNPYIYHLVGTDQTALAYKFIGFGSTLQEDLLPDTKKQMVTMYHCDDYVDCSELRATHYCAKMNQPEFILNTKETKKGKFVFDCNMKTKLCNSNEDHIHKIILEFSENGNHLKSSYLGWTDQKPNKKNSIYHFDRK
ncbi:hypothetical protein [Sulfurovum riftiae]|uniref:Uncharacterized protein n=1 Tax=Sulfurovum riftiae TaxID=1630136 RepID=A0A151CIJ6_9BACT|nr:hypothetical protein [Sulfurovum riftiae]KYJ87264.1 hypothetical protein AS592_02680 [Sulfurovum riftiae]